MGNKLTIAPRVDTIDFPKSEQGRDYDLHLYKNDEIDPGQIEGGFISFISSIYLLQSGNILVSFYIGHENGVRNFLRIYSLPALKIIESYEFNQKTEGIYTVEYAIQLKNGNILAIYDKLYIFDGENIKEGPKNISAKLSKQYFKKEDRKFAHPKNPDKYIIKSMFGLNLNHMFEIQEGLLIYNKGSDIFSIKLDNLEDIQIKEIYTTWKEKEFGFAGNLDIVLHSEYYPENVYLIINDGEFSPSSSHLRIHNYQDFIKGTCNKDNTLDKLTISNSTNVFGMCEYNEQYLLLDTIINNIYIFDMIKKEKVAICAPTKEGVQPGRPPKGKFSQFFEHLVSEPTESITNLNRDKRINRFYRKIHKLKDGKILILNRQIKVVDVAMQKAYIGTDFVSGFHVMTDEYVACIGERGQIIVIKIFKED